MFISQKLKESSIAEYLLYMWQVEDTLRAFNLDIERIASEYIPKFQLDEARASQLREWYEGLIQMMHEEGKEEKGHLQVNNATLILLNDLHLQLLKAPKYPFYSAQYYKALPFIVEFRTKSQGHEKSEIENCFDALYGILLLKAQGKEISQNTALAVDSITKLLAMLSEYYKKDKRNELEL